MPNESGSVFDPRSALSNAISNAFVITLVLGLLVFLLVTGLVIYNMVRFRRREGDDSEPVQVAGNRRLEITWTIGPLVLATGLMVMTFFTMGAADPPKEAGQQPDLEIIGHQWWWEYRYPKENIVTANELHIPAGKRLYARFSSGDVIHQWWVPALGRMMNSNPEQINYTWVQADQPGVYVGACAQYCGGPHGWMLIKVVAQTQPQFDAWVQQQKQDAPAVAAATPATPSNASVTLFTPGKSSLAGGDATKGAQVFAQNTCVNCHAINGTNAKAQVAPNLTHLGGRSIIGAGVLPTPQNDPNLASQNLAKWIYNPQVIKPGVLMPGYQLSEDDMRNLVAYLEGLK